MKLEDWIVETGRKRVWVAEQIGVSSVTLWHYCSGRRKPSLKYAARIQSLTEGNVTAADFFDEGKDDE